MIQKLLDFMTRQHFPSQPESLLTTEYKNQVGGKCKISKLFGDHILKPTTITEVESYQKMSSSISEISPDCCFVISNGQLMPLRSCHFCLDKSNANMINALLNESPSGHFLVMRDAAYGLIRPRILDLKVGTRTYSDWAPEHRKQEHIKKALSTTSMALGLRLSGVSFYQPESDEKTVFNRKHGRTLDSQGFFDFLATFFQVSEAQKQVVVKKLMKIKEVLEKSESQRFFACSLLIAIDDNGDEEFVEKTVKVKLIDFSKMARSEPGKVQYTGVDAGAILGVTTLIEFLKA